MSLTARAKEIEIRNALAALIKTEKRPALVAGLYLLMRIEFEDNFPTPMMPRIADNPLPRSRPALLAGRDGPTVISSLARLMDVGLLREVDGGYDLPQVRRILEIRARDRGYKSDKPPDGRNSDLLGSEVRSETGSETPPLVSPFPTPLSSSLPSPIHSFGEIPEPSAECGDALDRKLRSFIGGHRMLEWNRNNHAIARKMAESGGWTGMVLALDKAIAQGVSEPFTYARKIMAGDQARDRLKANGEAEKPKLDRVTKARTFNV